MRFLLLIFGLSALLLNAFTVAAGRPALPDTVAGEAHLTARFTRGICEQIAMQSRHQDLTVLTKAQGQELLNEVIMAVVVQDSTEFQAVLARTPDPTAAVQRLSMQAVLGLARACPSASRLLVQMGLQMAAIDTTLTPTQQPVLQAVARSFCEKLAAADAQRPLSQRTASERIAALREVRHEVILAHGAALVEAFGERLLTNQQLENSMWQNVDRLMFDACPSLTAQLRIDRGLAQLQAAAEVPATNPRPPAAPRAAAPVRRPARKK